MKVETTKKITVNLELTEEEARWLKETVQNPIGCTVHEEEDHHKEMRLKFFFALKEIGNNSTPLSNYDKDTHFSEHVNPQHIEAIDSAITKGSGLVR